MLLIETYLDRSSIHRIGLFSSNFIPRGTVVWKLIENDPSVLIYEQDHWTKVTQKLEGESLKQITNYTYKSGEKYFLLLDDSRFMNHSSNANIGYLVSDKNLDANECEVALRDIQPGEELTCDYKIVCDMDFFEEHELEFINRDNEVIKEI